MLQHMGSLHLGLLLVVVELNLVLPVVLVTTQGIVGSLVVEPTGWRSRRRRLVVVEPLGTSLHGRIDCTSSLVLPEAVRDRQIVNGTPSPRGWGAHDARREVAVPTEGVVAGHVASLSGGLLFQRLEEGIPG